MPSDHIDCPFCSKKVSRINFGAHLLSKEHSQRFYDENKSAFNGAYNRVVEKKEDPEKLLCLKAGSEQVRICLGCKRCYAYVAMRKEATTHFEDHPDCCEKVRKALTTLCGPKEVVIADPDALQRENDALKREIERLKKQPVITTPAPIVMTEGGITQEMYDEVVREKEAAEEESEQLMPFRRLWKEFLPGAFAGPADFAIEISEIKDFLARRKEVAAVPPPPKPKLNEERVAAYVEANIRKDSTAMCELGKSLTNEEGAEANKRLLAHFTKPAPAPAPSSAAFKPPPINPPVLTSTLKKGKQTDAEKLKALLKT